jgi:transposase
LVPEDRAFPHCEEGIRTAAAYTLIETAKLDNHHPQASLIKVLACITDYPTNRVRDLLPWSIDAATNHARAA